MVPATATPLDGIAVLGGVVTYKIFPVGVPNIVDTGDVELPIVPRVDPERVHPLVLFPDTI
jgi:hypothetical protein